MRKSRPWETDSEMGQNLAIVFVYHCKDLAQPLTSPFPFQTGHPDLNFSQYFSISWPPDEAWINKSTESFPGNLQTQVGLDSGLENNVMENSVKSPELYSFPLVLESGVFFTGLSITEVARGRLQWCDQKGRCRSMWGYSWRKLTWGFPFKLNLFLSSRNNG